MARTPLRNLRVDDETWDRWEAEARDRGYSLSEFIRECVEAEMGAPETTLKKKKRVTPALPATGGPAPRGDLGATEVRPMFKGGK